MYCFLVLLLAISTLPVVEPTLPTAAQDCVPLAELSGAEDPVEAGGGTAVAGVGTGGVLVVGDIMGLVNVFMSKGGDARGGDACPFVSWPCSGSGSALKTSSKRARLYGRPAKPFCEGVVSKRVIWSARPWLCLY